MREIITTPCDKPLVVMCVRKKGEKIDVSKIPFFQAMRTPNKHLYIEYDDNTLLVNKALDLDALGLAHITTVEELDKYMPQPYISIQIGGRR